MENGNESEKVTNKRLYELLIPIVKDITEIKTLLNEHLGNYKQYCENNTREHKNFSDILSSVKIKIWGLSAAIAIFSGIVGAIIGKYL